jgi:hypothetical protein
MNRGHAEFPVMKGFDTGIMTKGDVAKEEELSDKTKGGPGPKGKIRVKEDDLTIDPELGLVESAAKRDIKDSYVSDCQGERVGKGYEVYNSMVAKGIAADIEINPYNVGEAMDRIAEHSGMVTKDLDGGIVTKIPGVGVLNRIGRGIKEGAQYIGSKIPMRRSTESGIAGEMAVANKRMNNAGTLEGFNKAQEAYASPLRKRDIKVGGAVAAGTAAGAGGMALAHGERDQGYKYGKPREEQKCSGAPVMKKGIEEKAFPPVVKPKKVFPEKKGLDDSER